MQIIIREAQHIEYDTTDKQNCDLVQAIIAMSNISAALTVINRKNNKHKTIYRLYIRNNNRQDLRYFNNDYIDYAKKHVRLLVAKSAFFEQILLY